MYAVWQWVELQKWTHERRATLPLPFVWLQLYVRHGHGLLRRASAVGPQALLGRHGPTRHRAGAGRVERDRPAVDAGLRPAGGAAGGGGPGQDVRIGEVDELHSYAQLKKTPAGSG